MTRTYLLPLVVSAGLSAGCPGCGGLPGILPVPDGDLVEDGGGQGADPTDAGPPPSCDPRAATFDGEPALVRLVILLDLSGSLQFTDQNGRRSEAIRNLLLDLASSVDVEFTLYGYGSALYSTGPLAPVADFVEPAWLDLVDVQTDLSSALALLGPELIASAQDLDEGDRARSLYQIMVLTDGMPGPICCTADDETVGEFGELDANCPADLYGTPTEGVVYCDGREEQLVCNDAQPLANFRDNHSAVAGQVGEPLAGLVPGADHNRLPQLVDAVGALRETLLDEGVAEVRVHVGQLADPSLDPQVADLYRIEACLLKSVVVQLAAAGNGTSAQLDTREPIDLEPLFVACPEAP